MTSISSFPWTMVTIFAIVSAILSLIPIRKHIKAIYLDKQEVYVNSGIANGLISTKQRHVVYFIDATSDFLILIAFLCAAVAFKDAVILRFQTLLIGMCAVIPFIFMWIICIFTQNKHNSKKAPVIIYSSKINTLITTIVSLAIIAIIVIKIINGLSDVFSSSSIFETILNFTGLITFLLTTVLPSLFCFVLGILISYLFGKWICTLIASAYTRYALVDDNAFIRITDPEHSKMTGRQLVIKVIMIILSIAFMIVFLPSKSIIMAGSFSVSSENILRAYLGDSTLIVLSSESEHVFLLGIQWILFIVLFFIDFYIIFVTIMNIFGSIYDKTHTAVEGIFKLEKTLLVSYLLFIITETIIVLLRSLTYDQPLHLSLDAYNIACIVIYILFIVLHNYFVKNKNKLIIPSLLQFTVGKEVTTIDNKTFPPNNNFSHLIIPQGVTVIDRCALIRRTNLKVIYMPDSIISIGDTALAYCSNLQEIYYSGTKEQWKSIKKGFKWNECTKKFTIHCVDGDI